MVKNIILVLLLFLIVGCGSNKQIVKEYIIKEVKVPVVEECPTPPNLEKPDLIIDTLTNQDTNDPGKVSKAYKATVKQLQGYIEQLESILDAYRK